MIVSCAGKRRFLIKRMRLSPLDPSSFSRPESAVITRMHLILTADFERKIFHGTAKLFVKKIIPDATEITMDAKDLNITEIYDLDLHRCLNYKLSQPYKEFGSKLCVDLPPKRKKTYRISICYETSRNASGLFWVEPEQTFGKEHPFVYSHFLPNNARSFMPCQDTPAVRITYKALITVPKTMTVIMSSPRRQKRETGEFVSFYFTETAPTSVHLIAIAVGALVSKEIGPRSHVWAEKEVIEEAAKEFSAIESQMCTVEQILGPYVWSICDLLIPPPNYPYDSLAFPFLIYVPYWTITGDKSMSNVIVHEIIRGWFGNLITDCNFEHSWLTKALVKFTERKVVGHLTTLEDMNFEIYCGKCDLIQAVEEIGYESPLTSLVPDLSSRYPQETFTRIPYEKGYIFLRHLEVQVGGSEIFEPFLSLFIETYKGKTIDSETFQSFFEFYFMENECSWKIDWSTWLYMTGMPPMLPQYDDTIYEELVTYKKRWLNWNKSSEEIPFNKRESKGIKKTIIIQLLKEILEEAPQTAKKLEELDKIFRFDSSGNAEIRYRWYLLVIKARWAEKLEDILDWINAIGCMKFVRDLYKKVFDWEDARELVVCNFQRNCCGMPYVCVYEIINELGLQDDLVLNKKKYPVVRKPSFYSFAPRDEFHYCACDDCMYCSSDVN